MSQIDRLRLSFHGAIVLLVGLLCGLPTTVESLGGESVRVWHMAHEALIMMGVWMLVAASVRPILDLRELEARVFVWSLLAMGYSFAVSLVLGGIAGVSPFAPGRTPVTMLAFLAAVLGILGAVLAASLTIMGALRALNAVSRDA